MKTARVGDIDIAYRDTPAKPTGGGLPAVLLVHGFPLDHSMWGPVCERLEGDCHLIAPDLRGYGRTTLGEVDPAEGVPMSRYADDLAGLLEAIGVVEPVVYAGFSMGGYVGWQFLKRHGGRVRGLAMCDTRAAADAEPAREMRLKMARHVAEWGAERVAEAMAPKLFAAASIDAGLEAVARTKAVIASTDPRAIAAAQLGMAARPDVTSLLPGMKVFAELIVGEEDGLSPPAEMRSMADAMPLAELTIVPDAGHMAPVENPDAVASAIRSLLERC